MQVFRPLDGLAAEVAARSPPLDQWRKFVYCESLTGRLYGEVDHFKVGQHCCSGAACIDIAVCLSSRAAVLLCCSHVQRCRAVPAIRMQLCLSALRAGMSGQCTPALNELVATDE